MVGTVAGPLNGAFNEVEAGTVAGSGALALNLIEAEGLRVDDAGVGSGALTALGDLAGASAGSGEVVGGVGEEDVLSAVMDARGGKHRRVRCSST